MSKSIVSAVPGDPLEQALCHLRAWLKQMRISFRCWEKIVAGIPHCQDPVVCGWTWKERSVITAMYIICSFLQSFRSFACQMFYYGKVWSKSVCRWPCNICASLHINSYSILWECIFMNNRHRTSVPALDKNFRVCNYLFSSPAPPSRSAGWRCLICHLGDKSRYTTSGIRTLGRSCHSIVLVFLRRRWHIVAWGNIATICDNYHS